MGKASEAKGLDCDSVKIIRLPRYCEDNGDLVVIEGLINVPFPIARVFMVQAPNGAIRGQHAHRACTQFLTCPRGVVEVQCDDSATTAIFVLDRPDIGLLVPPGIWCEQTYRLGESALAVLCDRPYEADDYIRQYPEYLAYRRAFSVAT